jgi:hypothetical protein
MVSSRRTSMPKVFGVHEIELRPEVDPSDFERYFAENVVAGASLPGWTMRLLKGDRGHRSGKYLVLLEVESVETRDRYFSAEGRPSEEFEEFTRQHPDWAAAWEKSSSFEAADVVTDYVVVAE